MSGFCSAATASTRYEIAGGRECRRYCQLSQSLYRWQQPHLHLDRSVPSGLDILLIADNCWTHKHRKGKACLVHRPRYHIHYTPTYASWLNQVEGWFGLSTQQAIRRGSFRSTRPRWSVRSAATASGISKSAVARYFALFGLQPHRSRSFKLFKVRQLKLPQGNYGQRLERPTVTGCEVLPICCRGFENH